MKNLFAFHGVDHKSGVTMITQSVAELLAAQNSKLNILFMALNGRKSDSYLKGGIRTIDNFKLQMESKLLISKELARDCRYKGNLYVLGGLENEQEERYYFPEAARYLLEAAASSFDLVLVDTGSCLDSGLALGGLLSAAKRYLILTQQESNLSRYEQLKPLYEKVQISFEGWIVNRYIEEDPHTLKYVGERLFLDKEKLARVQLCSWGRQAEREHKTLLDFRTDCYEEDISNLASTLAQEAGLPPIKRQRKSKLWKNFI
ncbi:hypothetical protein Ami103574_11665 [Aminipila butyrica]|uniref:AAA domain-containing protein n=1 Tax=Aminipila butyrica TaxID=433296 RepID=A0A858BXW7_9FIRM|nr:hypothetical protein [Aminipila butyrica]QIB69938.1 hypothetical protein Ami103574_11665 [Aminipila butyrica]